MKSMNWNKGPSLEMKFLCLLALTLCFSFSSLSLADTNVSGDITSDTTWDLAGSPYIMTGDVHVTNGATLTIDNGLVIKMASGISLWVGYGSGSGTLYATNVTFEQYDPPNEWGKIRFGYNSVHHGYGTLDGCVIRGAGQPRYSTPANPSPEGAMRFWT